MPVWGWSLIAAIAGVAVTAARSANSRKRTERLKERFGPEHQRTT
jgi:hypothetical protein